MGYHCHFCGVRGQETKLMIFPNGMIEFCPKCGKEATVKEKTKTGEEVEITLEEYFNKGKKD